MQILCAQYEQTNCQGTALTTFATSWLSQADPVFSQEINTQVAKNKEVERLYKLALGTDKSASAKALAELKSLNPQAYSQAMTAIATTQKLNDNIALYLDPTKSTADLAQLTCHGNAACIKDFQRTDMLSGVDSATYQLVLAKETEIKAQLATQTQAATVITQYEYGTLAPIDYQAAYDKALAKCQSEIPPGSDPFGISCKSTAEAKAKEATSAIYVRSNESAALIASCKELGGANCSDSIVALDSLGALTGNPDLDAAMIQSQKLAIAQESQSYSAVAKSIGNTDKFAEFQTNVANSDTTWTQVDQAITGLKQDPLTNIVMSWNNFTSGRFERGNTMLLAGEQQGDLGMILKGGLIQGGDAAFVITAAVAAPLAFVPLGGAVAGVGIGGFLGTGMGIAASTQMVGTAADTCTRVGQGGITQANCNSSLAMATISVAGTGLGVIGQSVQAVAKGAEVGYLTGVIGSAANASPIITKLIPIANLAVSGLSTATFTDMAIETCSQPGVTTLDCSSSIMMAVAAGTGFASSAMGGLGLTSVATTQNSLASSILSPHVASSILFATSACSKLGESQTADTLAMCTLGLSGLGQTGMEITSRTTEKLATSTETSERIATPEELAKIQQPEVKTPLEPVALNDPIIAPKPKSIFTQIGEFFFGPEKAPIKVVDTQIILKDEYKPLVEKLGELKEARGTSTLSGKDPILVAETITTPEGKNITQFKFNEQVTERAGLTTVELDKLNTVFSEYQVFSEKSIGYDPATGLRGQQAEYLISGLEAFATNGTTGSLFGALPGLGKTEVILPMMSYLHASMTSDPQFILFSETKLMSPWLSVDSQGKTTTNQDIISFFEAKFGKDSVLILEPGKVPSAEAVNKSRIIVSTRDIAFELQNVDTLGGRALREKWGESYKFVDESHQTTNLFENFRRSDTEQKISEITEAYIFKEATKTIRDFTSINEMVEARKNDSLLDVNLTSDGKTGEYTKDREAKILNELLDKNKSILPSELKNRTITEVNLVESKQLIDKFIDQNFSTNSQVKSMAAELTAINKMADLLVATPGTQYGLTSSNGELSIAPREQSRVTGRTYSSLAEQILYNTVGVEILKGVGEMSNTINIKVDNLTVSRSGTETTYARLILEGKGFAMFTGTPELMSRLYKIAYGIELKVFSSSAFETVSTRFTASENNSIFTSIEEQVAARSGEGRNQTYINMDAETNNATMRDLLAKQNPEGKTMFIVEANGAYVEGKVTNGKFEFVRNLEDAIALGKAQDSVGDYIKMYEYGAHTGVDTPNNVTTSRAIGICNGCDQTTFSQGINRVRLDANGNAAPMDIIVLDSNLKNIPRENLFAEFSRSTAQNEVRNMTIAEVNFKEILLKTSVDLTIERVLAQTNNGFLGSLLDGGLRNKVEAIQQSWKEINEYSYRLENIDYTPEQKLGKTLDQVKEIMQSLDTAIGNNSKARTEFEASAGNYKDLSISFGDIEIIKPLGDKPTLANIVELINNTSVDLKNTTITFREKSPGPETIVANAQEAINNQAQSQSPTFISRLQSGLTASLATVTQPIRNFTTNLTR